jgi:hypothetical protein
MYPKRVVLGLAVALLLAASLAAPTRASVSVPSSTALVPHGPIRIVGDANFTAANGVTGGDGTPGNPYVISGWNITDAWPGNGLTVWDTRAYLVIEDVFINASYRDVEPEFPRGVALYNVAHVTVERVTVLNNAYAFTVGLQSSNVTFQNNVAVGNWLGVGIFGAVDVRVEGNLLQGGNIPNPSSGMSVGITMGYCGVPVCPAFRVTVVGNNITNNIAGIRVFTSSAVAVYHNNFVNDTNPASADAANYSWDNGYPIGGNYWSNYSGVDNCSGPQQNVCTGPDGIGDTPFTFPTGAEDRYPLMRPLAIFAGNTPPLDVDFTWGPVGTTVTFTSSVSGGTPPYAYLWDFGDGNRTTDAQPVHTYATAGTFSVTATVTDALGQNANRTLWVSVSIPGGPLESTLPLALGVAVVAAAAFAIGFAALWLRERRRRAPPSDPRR